MHAMPKLHCEYGSGSEVYPVGLRALAKTPLRGCTVLGLLSTYYIILGKCVEKG